MGLNLLGCRSIPSNECFQQHVSCYGSIPKVPPILIGAASGSGGCAGSATYESSILSGSTSKHSLLWQYKKASGTYELIPRFDVLAEIKNYFKKMC